MNKKKETIKILEENQLTNIYSPEDQIKMKLNDLSNPDDKFNEAIEFLREHRKWYKSQKPNKRFRR